jgi:BirA family biotin operon repressor/biotin-[acetyl-CoA-carboxylase] ligase
LNPRDDLSRALTISHDRLGIFTDHVQWYDELTSTNDVALAAAEVEEAEGLVIAADRQTRGRGRLGRLWSSPPGVGLYVSVLLRPSTAVLPVLTLAAGVAVADAVQTTARLPLALKWPNDACVWRDGQWLKIAGILTEAGVAPSGRRHAVVGIGINVRRGEHGDEVQRRASDLETECGRDVDRASLLVECLVALAARYRQLHRSADDRRALLDAWRGRAAATLGRAVEWETGGTAIHGVADGIDRDGALLIRTATAQVRVTAGEVRWI